MKKFLPVLVAALMCLFANRAAAEQINNFNVTVRVNLDASLRVQETIAYDFGESERHGIYRDIPVKYSRSGGNYTVRVSNVSVSDENGAAYKFSQSTSDGYLHLKIGDSNATVTGQHTYVVSYSIRRAINYFNDHDEVYWNFTGNSWTVPIVSAQAEIIFPRQLNADEVKITCFFGETGSSEACQKSSLEPANAPYFGAEFAQISVMPGQGLTGVVSLPKGLLAQPSVYQNVWDIVTDNFMLGLPFLVFAFLYYKWRRSGRDADSSNVIVAEYEVPEGLTPAEAGTLIDEQADNADITSEIIQLAVMGYIKISRLEEKVLWLFDSVNYQLDLIKPKDNNLTALQSRLVEGLFAEKMVNNVPSVKLSELKNKFYADMQRLKSMAYEAVVAKGYFLKNPQTVRNTYIGIGIFVGIAGWFAAGIFQNIFWLPSLLISGVIILVFGFFMPAKTALGSETKRKILGLKLYMSVAEKDRMEFHNAPEKNPRIFEKLLPFAIALGVSQQWAKQFESLNMQPPRWYAGSPGGMFNALVFTQALNNFSNSANAALVSRPQSAGSGGSGFGGGGFSGGGFGGGGGGSW